MIKALSCVRIEFPALLAALDGDGDLVAAQPGQCPGRIVEPGDDAAVGLPGGVGQRREQPFAVRRDHAGARTAGKAQDRHRYGGNLDEVDQRVPRARGRGHRHAGGQEEADGPTTVAALLGDRRSHRNPAAAGAILFDGGGHRDFATAAARLGVGPEDIGCKPAEADGTGVDFSALDSRFRREPRSVGAKLHRANPSGDGIVRLRRAGPDSEHGTSSKDKERSQCGDLAHGCWRYGASDRTCNR